MLKWLHSELGLVGSIIAFFVVFMGSILWFAGLSGLIERHSSGLKNGLLIAAAVIFPPIPVFWMIFDIFQQRRSMRT